LGGLFDSAVTAARLYLMRRRQFDNLALRRYFSERHDIVVGLYSYGCFDRWRMPGPLRVGRYCSFASTVRSALQNHPVDGLTTHPALYDPGMGVVKEGLETPQPLVIEDDVWVGQNALILPGCKFIGRGAIIGAGSVVTRDVEPYAIVAGNPAKMLRRRFAPELAEAIEASRWWDMDLPELRRLVEACPDAAFKPTVESLAAWRGTVRR
jgi:acetyltransferase-like isoleucine patch superfamily enzyme